MTGECTECGSTNVDYAPIDDTGEDLVYYGVCLDCGTFFQEVGEYNPLFSQTKSKNSIPAEARKVLEQKLEEANNGN